MIEVLSPHPRIGTVEERVNWFREYGVRECWLVGQIDRRVRVLQFAAGEALSIRECHEGDPIESDVLPGFGQTLVDILGY